MSASSSNNNANSPHLSVNAHANESVNSSEDWDIGTGVKGYMWQANNSRAVLLLQHGYGEYAQRYAQQYSQLIGHLQAQGISVYAIDLHGHGYSSGQRGQVDVAQAVQDHFAARRILAAQQLPIFLMGHSLGGLVTASSVVQQSEGIQGVILSSAALDMKVPAPVRLLSQPLAKFLPSVTVQPPIKAKYLSRIDAQVNNATNDPLMYHGSVPLQFGASLAKVSHANWPHYKNWTTPVLLMHGTKDKLVPYRSSTRFMDTIAASDKNLYTVKGGYHELLNDIGHEETLAQLLHWLIQRLPSAKL